MTQRAGPATPVLPAGFSLQSAAPVVIFLVVNRLAGLRWAVIAATIWSVKVVIDRRRKGLPLGRFMPIVTAAVLVRGAIGAITGSEAVYFGLGIASKYAVAAVLMGSAAIGRPLASAAAPYVMDMPPGMATHRLFHTTMRNITLVAGLYYCISATFDIWLFRRSSVEGFVLIRFLANWPLSAATIIIIVAIAQRLQRIPGVESVTAMVEHRLSGLGMYGAGQEIPSDTAVEPEHHPDSGQCGSQE